MWEVKGTSRYHLVIPYTRPFSHLFGRLYDGRGYGDSLFVNCNGFPFGNSRVLGDELKL